MIHAIVVTLVRLAVTHRKMLEWQTAATSAHVSDATRRSGLRPFVEQMLGSPVLATCVIIAVALVRPRALPGALPILLLWLAAPLVAYELSQPFTRRQPEINPEDRRLLRIIARKTWRFFETFVGAGDHNLPPDNFQDTPQPVIAHRTSPTNIGMGLLAALAAHDLRFISTRELTDRVEATLSTIEGMERFDGHLFNWYDSQTLVPLAPRYVSSVDSGNLAAALITLANGLRQLPTEPKPYSDLSGLEEVVSLLRRALEVADRDGKHRPEYRDLRTHLQIIRTIVVGSGTVEDRLAALAGPSASLQGCESNARCANRRHRRGRNRLLDRAPLSRHRDRQATGLGRARTRGMACAAGPFVGRRHELPPALRQSTRVVVGRLSSDRCREPRPPRYGVLRSAGLRGAPRKLHRHRQGRRTGSSLVPTGPASHKCSGTFPRCCRGARRCSNT